MHRYIVPFTHSNTTMSITSHTLYSPFKEITFPEQLGKVTLPDYLLSQAQKAVVEGKEDWIIDGASGRRRKFCELDALSRSVGSAFFRRGLRKGDAVLYLSYDMFHIYSIFLGVWRANGMLRASYPEDNQETLLERVKESGVKWIICELDAAQMCLTVAAQVPWDVEVFVDGECNACTPLTQLFDDDGSALPTSELHPSDTAFVFCTSGTTGKSKGCVHTHRSLLHQIHALSFNPWSENRNLIVSKATYVMGAIVLLTCLSGGKTCITVSKITKEKFSKAVDKFKPQLVFGLAPVIISFLDMKETIYDFSSIEIMSIGGSLITDAVEEALRKPPNVKLVLNSYGLTEVLPIATDIFLGSKVPAKYPGTPSRSIGKVYAGLALQIRDPDTLRVLGPFEQGEIWVKSKTQFECYYKNPKATENAFHEGWVLTGDMGYFDDNEFLFIVDRIKEIFKYYGNQVSPSELEEIIHRHPSVAEVCVFPIDDPESLEKIPRAFVTLRFAATEKQNEDIAKEIKKFVNDKVADYKQLRGGVFVVKELQRGKTGKVSRQLLAELPIPSMLT